MHLLISTGKTAHVLNFKPELQCFAGVVHLACLCSFFCHSSFVFVLTFLFGKCPVYIGNDFNIKVHIAVIYKLYVSFWRSHKEEMNRFNKGEN